ncbi:MAG: transcriptional repressor [Planctomycetaceae bacterium]|jgi:Fur family ferric uptake transcriptional regulator|nr:transcriptional repressor [Phycisphaerales bacterium]MCE2652047.1 transcriptional repressor [Planctomycetaceae bacterium]
MVPPGHDHASHSSDPKQPAKAHPDFAALLRQVGLRVTRARVAILETLHASDVAISADEVSDRLSASGEAADRVTVYRTLTSFVEEGLAHKVDPGDRKFRFSLTDHAHCHGDHHQHEHPHLVCDSCGEVQCVDDAEVVLRPKRSGKPGGKSIRLNQSNVTLHGVCEKCDDPSQPPPPKPGTSSGPNLR